MTDQHRQSRLFRSTFIPGSSSHLLPGVVVHYRTHEDHSSDGWNFPAGTSCLATRTPSGQVGLFFMLPYEEGRKDFARVVWLPEEYGLCGVEPHVLDPRRTSHLMAQKVCDEATARVVRELRQESERTSRRQSEVEEDIAAAAARHVAEDLDRDAAAEIAVALGANGTWNTADSAEDTTAAAPREGTAAGDTAAGDTAGVTGTAARRTSRPRATGTATVTPTAPTGTKPRARARSSSSRRASPTSTPRPSTSARSRIRGAAGSAPRDGRASAGRSGKI